MYTRQKFGLKESKPPQSDVEIVVGGPDTEMEHPNYIGSSFVRSLNADYEEGKILPHIWSSSKLSSLKTHGMHVLLSVHIELWSDCVTDQYCANTLLTSDRWNLVDVMAIFSLPSGIYIDPYELMDRHTINWSEVFLHTQTSFVDYESIASSSANLDNSTTNNATTLFGIEFTNFAINKRARKSQCTKDQIENNPSDDAMCYAQNICFGGDYCNQPNTSNMLNFSIPIHTRYHTPIFDNSVTYNYLRKFNYAIPKARVLIREAPNNDHAPRISSVGAHARNSRKAQSRGEVYHFYEISTLGNPGNYNRYYNLTTSKEKYRPVLDVSKDDALSPYCTACKTLKGLGTQYDNSVLHFPDQWCCCDVALIDDGGFSGRTSDGGSSCGWSDALIITIPLGNLNDLELVQYGTWFVLFLSTIAVFTVVLLRKETTELSRR